MSPSTLDNPVPEAVVLDEHAEPAATIVRDVFSTMLNADAWPVSTGRAKPFPIAGTVYFTGGFMGAVVIELDYELAFQATSVLMEVPRPAQVDPDVRDSVGELTNMIAGNLKAILPSTASLSMPSVVEGKDFAISVVGGNQASKMYFESQHGPMTLTLVQMRPRNHE